MEKVAAALEKVAAALEKVAVVLARLQQFVQSASSKNLAAYTLGMLEKYQLYGVFSLALKCVFLVFSLAFKCMFFLIFFLISFLNLAVETSFFSI